MSGGLLGAVLAGGRSRRFGSDKALAMLDGRRLIDRVADDLLVQVDAVVICGRAAHNEHLCLPDRPAPDLGPLGGLNAALRHARDHGYRAVVSVPCDMPGLPADLVVRLCAAGAPAVVDALPVIGLWPAALADLLAAHLAATDDRAVRRWAALAGAAVVPIDGLDNINAPADLHRLADRRA